MSLVKELHKRYAIFFNNGVFNAEAVDINEYMKEERLSLIERLYDFVLDEKVSNDFIRMYIMNSTMTLDEVIDNYNKNSDKPVNVNTAKSKMVYNTKKISSLVPDIKYKNTEYNMLGWLLDNKMFMGVETDADKKSIYNRYVDCLDSDNTRNANKLGKNTIIKIPKAPYNKEVDNESFNDFLDMIKPYSKKYIKTIENLLLENFKDECGYYKYLLNNSVGLSEKDKRNKILLLETLGLDDADILKTMNISQSEYLEIKDNSEETSEQIDTDTDDLEIDF